MSGNAKHTDIASASVSETLETLREMHGGQTLLLIRSVLPEGSLELNGGNPQ